MMQELTDEIRSLANGKTVEPDRVSTELLNITLNGHPALRRKLLDIVVCLYYLKGGRCRCSGNMSSSWYSTKIKIGHGATTTGVSHW